MKIAILFFFMILTNMLSAEENFILLDDTSGKIVRRIGPHVDKRMTPCSTFKISLSLMGYDSGILFDEENPECPFQEGYVDALECWKASHNPQTWMKNSCVWYSQLITTQLGMEVVEGYLDQFQYGNRNMSGDPGKNNGLTEAWLSSSLKISPREQVYFLQKLVRNTLPVTEHALELTKYLLFIEELPGGWKLYGKTGSGRFVNFEKERKIAWFVGWIEKKGQTYLFAYNIKGITIDPSQRLPRIKQLLTEAKILK